jgi:hypothetical protein
MKKDMSSRVESTMKDRENVHWYSGTNVLPSVISALPGVLLTGGFIGLWSGMFFGFLISNFLGNLIWVLIVGVLAFLFPIALFAIGEIYESSKEEFVVTDRRIITVTANKLNIDMNAYDRDNIKQIGVQQGFVGDMMGVGNITVEVFQTDMQTDKVMLEGIDNPYDNLDELRGILSEELNGEDE